MNQPAPPAAAGDSWEGQAWEGQHAQWQQPAQPSQPVTQQPWTDPFPPAPTEPYWSQQLPENWNDTGPEADDDGYFSYGLVGRGEDGATLEECEY